jgi:hypothetical protein
MIEPVLIAALMLASPTKAPEKALVCRGVLLKDEQGSFLLITLKVTGDAPSRAKVRQAAERLGAYFSDRTDDEGRPILNVGFVSSTAAEDVERLWKDIEAGVYGGVTVEPFALPGSWITPDSPCFGSAVSR